MKKIEVDCKFWSFNECNNFIIIPGILMKYKENSIIKLVSRFLTYREFKAKILTIKHMRFCDIPSFQQWHLYSLLKANNFVNFTDSDEIKYEILNKCVKIIMKDLKSNFDEREIVTVIYFNQQYRYTGDNINIKAYDVYKEMIKELEA